MWLSHIAVYDFAVNCDDDDHINDDFECAELNQPHKMSALARDAAAFRSSLARQDFTSWHSNPSLKSQTQSRQDSGSSSSSEPVKKKSRPSKSCYPSLCGFGDVDYLLSSV